MFLMTYTFLVVNVVIFTVFVDFLSKEKLHLHKFYDLSNGRQFYFSN